MASMARGAGGYLALFNDDDGAAYQGPSIDTQVFVVAKGTEAERLFTADDLVGASAYATEVRKPLIGPPAGTLPNLAVRKLLGEELI